MAQLPPPWSSKSQECAIVGGATLSSSGQGLPRWRRDVIATGSAQVHHHPSSDMERTKRGRDSGELEPVRPNSVLDMREHNCIHHPGPTILARGLFIRFRQCQFWGSGSESFQARASGPLERLQGDGWMELRPGCAIPAGPRALPGTGQSTAAKPPQADASSIGHSSANFDFDCRPVHNASTPGQCRGHFVCFS